MDGKTVEIWTDGGCSPNPGPGAWAAVLRYGDAVKELAGNLTQTTNNVAEMTAVFRALTALKKPSVVTLYSDSQLVVNCGSRQWRRNANADLWAQIDTAAQAHTITWRWVKGHAGEPMNERCHQLVEMTMQLAANTLLW